MAYLPIKEDAVFQNKVRQLEPTDPDHANTFNPLFETLLNNDVFLKLDKMDRPTQQIITIPKDNWTASTYGFNYQRVVAVEGITAQDIPSCQVSVETETIAQDCNLAFQCQSGEGSITFYSDSVPTDNIICNLTILKGA